MRGRSPAPIAAHRPLFDQMVPVVGALLLCAAAPALQGCEEDPEEARPGEGTAPLFDPDLARCTATIDSFFGGRLVSSSTWTWDADGQRATIEDDLNADGEVDRRFEDTWQDTRLQRTVGEGVEDDYTFEERLTWYGPVLQERRTEVVDPWIGEDPVLTRVRYLYDLGLLEGYEVDLDDDGELDEEVELVWSDDFSTHVELHEDGLEIEREMDQLQRVLRQVERYPAPGPTVTATFVYDPANALWPRNLHVDTNGDGAGDVVMRWTYDCP